MNVGTKLVDYSVISTSYVGNINKIIESLILHTDKGNSIILYSRKNKNNLNTIRLSPLNSRLTRRDSRLTSRDADNRKPLYSKIEVMRTDSTYSMYWGRDKIIYEIFEILQKIISYEKNKKK